MAIVYQTNKKTGVATEQLSCSILGATSLFDRIGEKVGITADLEKSFPVSWEQILSVAYYLFFEDTPLMSRFPL